MRTPPPAPAQPPRVKGVSRAEAKGKLEGERDHDDHAEEAVLYKGFTFAHARRHAAHQPTGQGRPPAKNMPKSTPPPRKKKNASARTQVGDQQDQSSEIEVNFGEDEQEKRVAAAERLTFRSKDDDEADGNNNEGARIERRFKQIRLSDIGLGKATAATRCLAAQDFGGLMFAAANQIQSSAVLACTKSNVAKPIQPLSPNILEHFRSLLEKSNRMSCEQFSTLAGVRAVLVKLPRPASVSNKETLETIHLILPALLLNAANPRTDRMRYQAVARLASLKHGLKNTGARR